jgi:hypothetical protein
MQDCLALFDCGEYAIEKARNELRSAFAPKGRFKVEHFRDGKVIGEYGFNNGITDVGLNSILDVHFGAGSQITVWDIGLIDSASYTTGILAADVMNGHAGWIENEDYTEAARPAWGAGTAAARQITNASTTDFSMDATVTIKGMFIVGGTGSATKGGTTGTLWSTGLFGTPVACNSGDTLKVTYTIAG